MSSSLKLYVGQAPLRMQDRIDGPHLSYHCRFADIRELDGERLLASTCLADNVIAILARLRDERRAVRQILEKIAAAPQEARHAALSELTT